MRKAILAMAMATGLANAADIELSWDATTLDTEGKPIPAELISYLVFVSTNEGPPTEIVRHGDLGFTWQNVPLGCHTFYVKSHRSDSDLYSTPSNSVSKCIDEDTDDVIRLMMPRAPAELNATLKVN